MQYLLVAHIFAGCISLIAAVFAVVSSKGKQAHILTAELTFGEWL